LNFANGFLREDGLHKTDASKKIIIKHLDFLLEKLGENGVALGSDFDGACVPKFINDCSGLQSLVDIMRKAGYGNDLINKICSANWINAISKVIK
jgi:membrane dipeptidase